jgi:hypothetical protein
MLSCIPWFFIEIGCKTCDPRDDGCENDRDSAYKTEAAWWDGSLRRVAKMFLVSLPPIRLCGLRRPWSVRVNGEMCAANRLGARRKFAAGRKAAALTI